jgi:hypothetical protein
MAVPAWNPPADAVLGVGKPGKPSLARAIRDLPEAMAGRAAGAPWLNRMGALEIYNNGFGDVAPDGTRNLIGEWVAPEGVFYVEATLIGGGGAGGEGQTTSGTGLIQKCGGGGGAGAILRSIVEITTPGEVYAVIIGAGGNPARRDPSVDTTLDGWGIGDGARTTFGNLVAAGGRHGATGGAGGAGGAGGSIVEGQIPTVFGAPGDYALNDIDYATLGQFRSGTGASSYFGGGAPGRNAAGVGYDNWTDTDFGGACVAGAGGGGGYPEHFGVGGTNTKDGGRGGHGAVILRY